MDKKKGIAAAVLAMLIAACACFALYLFDNKYTARGVQPINGMIFLSEDELAANPVQYLTREWELYPGVALTPQEAQRFTGYRRLVDIGGPDNLYRGLATYRLTLNLPDTERLYALDIGEIYDSCRLYVNGSLLHALGDMGAGGQTLARPVCFAASGQVELLLVVSNNSGVYGGLTYPPAFGEVSEILSQREARLLLHTALALLMLFGGALSLCFRRQGGWRPQLIYSLLYLCLLGVVGYPLLHAFFPTAFMGWYIFEAICYYGLLLLAVLLECEWYGVKIKHTLFLVAPCAVGLGCAIAAFSGASLPAFSVVSTILKYYAAACLLGLSVRALLARRAHSVLLLCAGTAFMVMLIFDRLFPLYEPIYGGWFGELGGITLGLAVIIAGWLDAMAAFRFRHTYQSERQALHQRLSLQKEHYKQLAGEIERSRQASHDLRHHLRVVRSFAEQDKKERLLSYLDEYEPHLIEREITTFSDHLVADAILKYYAAEAKEVGAAYDLRFSVPPDIPFPDDELCILLSNLLENAIEALAMQTAGEKTLYLRGNLCDHRLGLIVKNTFDGKLCFQNERYLSTKREGGGLGLSSVRSIAEKHGGLADFTQENGIFQAAVWIPLFDACA